MSMEPGGVDSDSDADFGVNASRINSRVAQTSETLLVKLAAIEQKCCESAGKDGIEKRNGLCGEIESGLGSDETQGVDAVETSGSEIESVSDAESEDLCEKRDLDCSGKLESRLENLGGVVLGGSANENLKLSDSDSVWGKVRSYPWWPGQVVDASLASDKSMKYFKKGSFLVAYFGDSSFAWHDVSRVKPFHQHFSQMVKQSDSPDFRNAVGCALEEVSRRVEFGLSCACVSEEAYKKLETRYIMNPGIREDSLVRYGGDKLSSAIFFEPAKLVEYMKALACFPRYDETDKLEFVNNRAQLSAFQEWTSYLNFPRYETFLRSVGSAGPFASLSEPNTDEELSPKKRKTDIKDNAEQKQKFSFEVRIDEKTEEKSLSDCNADKRFGRSRLIEKFERKSHSNKKRKSLESGKPEKKIKNNGQKEDSVSRNSDDENNSSIGSKLQKVAEPCFGMGAIPLRMEGEVNSLTHTLNPCGDCNSTSKMEVENKTTRKRPELKKLAQNEISSPDEMLSSLHSAKTRMGMPVSLSLEHSNYEGFEKFVKETSCSNPNHDSKKESITETSETWNVKDSPEEQIIPDERLSSLHSAKTGKAIPESISIDHSNYAEFDQLLKEIPRNNLYDDDSKKVNITERSEPSDVKDSSDQQILPVNKDITDSGSKEQTGLKDCSADSSAPNALILKFASSGSVPCEEKLNSIFNRYGPLRESETRVMKKGKRAKVVFEKGEDAKAAFSSSGKYSIFGPSLLSYSLKYVCVNAKESNDITS